MNKYLEKIAGMLDVARKVALGSSKSNILAQKGFTRGARMSMNSKGQAMNKEMLGHGGPITNPMKLSNNIADRS